MAAIGDEEFSSYYVAPALAGPAKPAWRGMYARSVVARSAPVDRGALMQRGEYDPGTLGAACRDPRHRKLGGVMPGTAPSLAGAGVKLLSAYVAVQFLRNKSVPMWMKAPGAVLAVIAYVDEAYALYQDPSSLKW